MGGLLHYGVRFVRGYVYFSRLCNVLGILRLALSLGSGCFLTGWQFHYPECLLPEFKLLFSELEAGDSSSESFCLMYEIRRKAAVVCRKMLPFISSSTYDPP